MQTTTIPASWAGFAAYEARSAAGMRESGTRIDNEPEKST
jgi:hypothetical protein